MRDLYTLAGEALDAQKVCVVGPAQRLAAQDAVKRRFRRWSCSSAFSGVCVRWPSEHAPKFSSPGFTRFFAMLREELDDAYLELVDSQLKALKFPGGTLMSAQLASGNKGKAYTLRRPREQGLLGRIFDRSGYSFTIPDRDVGGFNALGTLEDRGANLVANALAQSVDHVDGFFVMLRTELGVLRCVPEPLGAARRAGRTDDVSAPGCPGRACAVGPRAVRRVPRIDDRAARRRQRRGRRR